MSSSNAPRQVKLSLPLKYQQTLFQELRAEDELVILARGLGLLRLISNLLHSYDAAGNNLVIVVGAEDRENVWLGEALAEHAAISLTPAARGLTVVNTDFTSVAAREKMYAAGGIFSVTSRILVVDLLTGLLGAETVTGMMVLHADRVSATSLEAFILRIYRQKNKAGFLKAFTDNPDAFAVGFSPLTAMLRNLFLRKASLWPRFQVEVADALEGKRKAEVIELEVPMTDSMRVIQTAIMECVEVSIHELKKGNSGLEMDDWNLDSALLRNFDLMVRRQLEPNWHRTSWKTRQIVGDLTVLRTLLTSVLTFDAVSLMQHLDTIHAAHAPAPGSSRQSQSPWLFLDAAQTIFETARKRVYAATRKAATAQAGGGGNIDALMPVLEELPKWSTLSEILAEIDRELYFQPPAKDDSNGTILIMCVTTDTCRQLREYLQTMHIKPNALGEGEGEDEDEDEAEPSAAYMMRRKLRNYLSWKRQFANVNATLFSENQKAINNALDPRLARKGPPGNRRRRVRGGGGGVTVSTAGRTANGSVAQFFEKPDDMASLMAEVKATADDSSDKPDLATADPLDNMEDYYELFDMNDLVVIHSYDGDQDEHVLDEIKPRYIVMYEPDAAFIRRVEVYRSSHNDRSVRVYFTYYQGSVEEQRYLSSVRREKDAFTKAIKERATMSLVMTADAPVAEDPQEAFLRTINTRIAGGGRLAVTAEPPRVVVDVREFRSSLPSLLHGRSMVIVPCMLTVGDYVLSPTMVVERKSISDLIASFRDGRLYTQAESMFAYYPTVLLLIEFDQNKSFTLEPFADYSGAAQALTAAGAAPDLHAKLVLLTLAFPRLRIVWSSSPYQTAEIFESLKSQEPEPDPIAAVRAGLEGGARAEDQIWSMEPRDMLAAVPGVTPQNLPAIARQAQHIVEVASMGVDELSSMAGKEDAKQIWAFFNKDLHED